MKHITNTLSKHNLITTKIILLLFFALSLLPLVWITNNTQYGIAGRGDFLSPITQAVLLEKRTFVYDPSIHGGAHLPFHMAGIVPITTFFFILKIFNISYAIASVFFISILLFIAEVSMYAYIRNVIGKLVKLNANTSIVLAFFAGVVYAFSPFFASLLEPGHFALLLPYSFFPLIILLLNKFFLSPKFNISSLMQLFFVFFFCATSFENVGIIYTLLIALGCYAVFLTIFERLSLMRTGFRFFLVILSIFASNIWWLLPFIISIQEAISLNNATNSINQALGVATHYANVYRLFFNQDPLLGKQVPTFSGYFIILIYLWSFAFVALFKIRKRITAVFLLMIIVGIFISKGPNEPFGNIFIWFYNHFPGFQIFRRPVQKIYWLYYFFLLTLSFGGMGYISSLLQEKKRLLYHYIPLTAFSFFLIASFLHSDHLKFFNIPQYYYEAKDVLISQNVNKILITPGFYGDSPYYNKTVNNYHGEDFIQYVWNFQALVPDPSTGSLATYEKNNVNKLMSNLRLGSSICTSAKEQGISHIMVRQDILPGTVVEDKPETLIKLLDNNKDIVGKKYFGGSDGGFTIFTINNDCRNDMVSIASKDSRVESYFENPTRISVIVTDLKEKTPLILRLNYDPAWKLYIVKKSENVDKAKIKNYVSGWITELYGHEFTFLKNSNQIAHNSHKLVYGYANSWTIDPNFIKSNFSKEYFTENKDGSVTIQLVLYYSSQQYFYWGLGIEAILFSGIIIYYLQLHLHKKRN